MATIDEDLRRVESLAKALDGGYNPNRSPYEVLPLDKDIVDRLSSDPSMDLKAMTSDIARSSLEKIYSTSGYYSARFAAAKALVLSGLEGKAHGYVAQLKDDIFRHNSELALDPVDDLNEFYRRFNVCAKDVLKEVYLCHPNEKVRERARQHLGYGAIRVAWDRLISSFCRH